TPLQLVHNALMGEAYARAILPYDKPRVGLLTIGTEEGKGTARIAEAHAMMKAFADDINYVGLIEGFDTFNDVADVVVCDGFTGNILLKTLESCYATLKGALKREIKAKPWRMAGAWLSRGAFKAMKENFSPEHYSGAPLLGLNGTVVKTHGSSDRTFIRSAIRIALETTQCAAAASLDERIDRANALAKTQQESATAVEFSG
ncbi:MAG: phosphate acyltransferase PlsX, partial [Verrucomicrobiota bacterium]